MTNIKKDEAQSVIERTNQTELSFPFVPVSEQIHAHALCSPDQTAVICMGKALSYGELECLSNRVANLLIKKGIGRDILVGVLLERTELAYVAEQGVLKAHGAFLPFTVFYPDERILFSMEDASAAILLTSRKLREERPALSGCSFEVLAVEDILETQTNDTYPSSEGIAPGDLAYCIYTSGSTGRPKGVMIEQGNLANYVHRNEKSVEIMHYAKPGRITLAMAAFSFDVSIVEQFVPLCNGNTVCLATSEEIHDPFLLAKMIQDNRVNGITCTPTFLSNIVGIPACAQALRQIEFFDVGSEAFPKNLYLKLRALREDSVILNVYGPTECAMGCAAAVMGPDGEVTVGGPMVNTQFYVMDTDGNILDVGEKGELIICGACVGRGYVNLPDRTAAAFFNYRGMRAYHSGDLVSWTEDGRICIWGRIDNQVKLRGFRIELDEIERVMGSYPDIKGSAVKLCHGDADYLAGYITSANAVDLDALRAFMGKRLPDYMIPSVIIRMDRFPETVNGKVDKKALPDPQPVRTERPVTAPRNDTERMLRDIFAEVLNLEPDQISVDDDFFELGGDSLRSMVLTSKLMDHGVTSAAIYSLRSIERIAAMLLELKQGMSLDEIEAHARKIPHYLSAMQTKLIDYQLAKTRSTMWNNMYYLFRFNRKTDPERLRKAVNQAIHHHPALSMKIEFNEHGELVQTYCPELLPEIQFETCTDMDVIRMKDELVQPFPMFNSPLLRVRMFLTGRYSYLFYDVHHLAMDGACIGLIMSSIVKAYHGEPLPPDYYCAYLNSEDHIRNSPKYLEDKAYFEKKYGGYDWCRIPEPDREESVPTAAGRVIRFPFDASDLEEAEKRLNTTRSVIAIAAAILTLHETSGRNDIMTNWIFNNRLGSFASDSVGMLIKNLPVGIHMDQIHSLQELIVEIKRQVADGISHCSYDYFAAQDSAFFNDPMEVNYQQNMNADELASLHPLQIGLENRYHAPGARLELEFLENDDNSGLFDSEMEWAANCFSEERIQAFHALYIDHFERIVLEGADEPERSDERDERD